MMVDPEMSTLLTSLFMPSAVIVKSLLVAVVDESASL